MQHLSQKQLHTLIQLEAQGRITPHQVYQRCALAKVQKADNYVSTAIAHIIGGVVLVGFAGQIVVPIVAASWLYTWLKSYRTRQDAIQRINAGDIAEFLDDDDRVSFEEDMQALTVEAIADPVLAETIPADPTPAAAPTTEPAAQSEPAAVAVATAPIAAPPLAPTIAQVAPETTDLALAMAKRLTSRIIGAAPRTGKGMLISTALSNVQRLRPDVELWALDIKAEPQEDPYYARFESRRVLRLSLMGFEKPAGADKRIQSFFHAFEQSTAQTKLLWVNECATLAAKLAPALWKQIQQFAVGLCSAGATGSDGQTGRFIWFDTQSPNVTDLGLRTNASRNVFRRIFLCNDDRSLLPSAVSSGFALAIEAYELDDLLRTPSGVAAFDSLTGEWVALPYYEAGTAPQPPNPVTPQTTPPPAPQTDISRAAALVAAEAARRTIAQAEQAVDSSELGRMKAVYAYLLRKEGGTKRDVQRASLPALKGLSSDDIDLYLEVMFLENFLTRGSDIYYHNPQRSP